MALDPNIIGTADPSRHTPPPLLKHALMTWLQDHPDEHPDTLALAKTAGVLPGGINRALWDLQKNGLVTFRERKHQNGGGNTTHTLDVMANVALTPKGKDWKPSTSQIMSDLGVDRPPEEDWNPEFVKGAVAEDIAMKMEVEQADRMLETLRKMPPAKALETVLRARGKPVKIRSMNSLLGYHAKSTAIYSLVRFNPEAFHIQGGYVHLDAPEGWEPKSGSVNAGRHRAPSATDKVADFIVGMTAAPLIEEARASVVLDGETQSVEPVVIPPTIDAHQYPEIAMLLIRGQKRTKVAEAVAALEAAGLDDIALSALAAVPDDTPLEAEVIAFVRKVVGS
jgi:hypothetical protein